MSEAPPHPALAEDLLPFDDAGRPAMEAAAGHAIACRLSLAESLAKPALRPAELASRFDHPLADAGEDAVSVIDTLVRDAGDGVHPHTSPRFFGYVCGGSMPVGAAADR